MEKLINEYGIFIYNEVTQQTPKEVFQEYLNNKNKPIEKQPTLQEILNAQLLKENAEQKLINAELLKQIAELKGGNTNGNV